ncbi:hypothetical protein EB083_03030 [bacterium]|nr:hypothetical protein [bacterium]
MITTFAILSCGAAFGLGLFGVLLTAKRINETAAKSHFSIIEVKTKLLNSMQFLGGPAIAVVAYLVTGWLLVSVSWPSCPVCTR